MKYLKLFEDVDNKYYFEISESEFQDYDLPDFVSMEDRYIRKLSEFRFSKKKGGAYSYDDVTWVFQVTLNPLMERYIYIYQMDDEWFLVVVTERHSTSKWINRLSSTAGGKYWYWKCDQFDGLMKFLKDKKLI